MQIVINSLVPIFAVIGVGVLLRLRDFLNAASTQGFNRFAYFFGLPLFLFHKLGNAAAGDGLANRFAATLILSTVVAMSCGWLFATLRKVPFASRGALIQASMRGNLAFMGVPLIMFVLADMPTGILSPERKPAIETAMLLSLAPVIIFYNFFSVVVLAIYNKDAESNFSWWSTLINVLTNPILLACLAGMLFQKMSWPIPTSIDRTCQVVGAAAFPMALVGIGSQLATVRFSERWIEPLVSSLIKCLLCPIAGWILASLIGLEGAERLVVVILSAMPTAVSSYVLADQMNADADLAASSVVFATVLSTVTLAILMASLF
jgi:predicted permease